MSIQVPPKERVSAIVKALRESLGLTVAEIADFSGKSSKTIYRWEDQESTIMRSSWVRLSRALESRFGITDEDLWSDDIGPIFRRKAQKYDYSYEKKSSSPESKEPAIRTIQFAADFSSPMVDQLLMDDDDPLLYADGNPPYVLKEDDTRHLLGSEELPEIPSKGLRRYALEHRLAKTIGLRKIEIGMLAELDLPDWASTPQVFTSLIMAYRDGIHAGDVYEGQKPKRRKKRG
ncbi:helix-turn-helix domain-containing protein [bacterium]|nr:helix-turn-helix domain-containing protein [bacterium]